MMTKEDFKECIEKIQGVMELGDKLSDLNIEIIDCQEAFAGEEIFFMWLKSEFGEEGEDVVGWWLFEADDKVVYEDTENGDKEIRLDTAEDLYDYLVENFGK